MVLFYYRPPYKSWYSQNGLYECLEAEDYMLLAVKGAELRHQQSKLSSSRAFVDDYEDAQEESGLANATCKKQRWYLDIVRHHC